MPYFSGIYRVGGDEPGIPAPRHVEQRVWSWPLDWPALGELSVDAREEAAQIIACRLKHLLWHRVASDASPRDPQAWRALAQELGYVVHEYADVMSDPGCFVPPGDPIGMGMIGINLALGDAEQCDAWLHELSHGELWHWVPPQLRGAADLYCYSGDIEEAQHEIARRVQVLILG